MDQESRTFESDSEFARAYHLIGRLELHLRYLIPITLSNYAEERGHAAWHEIVPLNKYAQNSLNRAHNAALMAKQDISTISSFLPLSFWRYLLIDLHMNSALRLRHNVAHYNLNCLGTLRFSQQKVEWLLDSLGVTNV